MFKFAGASFLGTMLAILVGSAATLPAALAADSSGPPGSEMHRGPAAWIEEYWDVKPEHFDEFVRSYRSEVYALARRIPGYRGYTFLTNLQEAPGRPNKGNTDKMIIKHYGIHLQGRILTERVIDLGNLLRQTHNVVIVHHFQDWTAADSFRARMDALYAREHGGEIFADRLAKTVYPLANNMWVTPFRLVETGFKPAVGRPGKDSDGLDLEPHASNKGWYKEYFDVLPKDLDKFLDVYRNNTYAQMKGLPGYEGVAFVTNLAPGKAEAARTHYHGELLGGPDSFYVPQPGVMMDGSIRTDTSINYSMLFRNTFSVITYYTLDWGVDMMGGMAKQFARTNPGEDRIKRVTRVFFPLAQNHWDMWYRGIETSFSGERPAGKKSGY